MSVHKDLQGRVLQKGETQRRSDKRYAYTYRDMYGYRRCVYAADLTELRRKEEHLIRDQVDGVDTYVSGVATLNYAFDRYMSVKKNLRPTTHANYLYMYDHFVRKTIGRQRIVRIKYSDILRFYNHLLEQGMQVNTLDSIHTLLHPTFQMAVRDQIIRINLTHGVMAEVKKATGHRTNVRHALTIDQQRAFMQYVAGHPYHSDSAKRAEGTRDDAGTESGG